MPSTSKSTVTMHVVSSLDGFIASRDNTVAWMDTSDVYERGVTGDGAETLQSIDCYVLGSRTYQHALELGWPYGATPTIVLTSRTLPSARPTVEFYSGDPEKLLTEKLAPRYRNIWLCGGAILSQSFLRLGLVDEIRLMIAPVTLGGGLRLFDDASTEQKWHLKNVIAYKNGYVDLSYSRPLDSQG